METTHMMKEISTYRHLEKKLMKIMLLGTEVWSETDNFLENCFYNYYYL